MNELAINLQTDSKVSLYQQIYDYIKTEIQEGKLRTGEKIPSTRVLSKHLQVSRSTVDLAYEQLISEGYIESRPYKGYFVSKIEELYRLDKKERFEVEVPNSDFFSENREEYEYDFSPNGIDLSSFPYNTWRKISKTILMDEGSDLFQSGDLSGEESLKSTISNYLHQARGVNCKLNQIFIGAGNDYLLMILAQILGGGYTIAMEDPTYKQAYNTFVNLNYSVNTISMDKNGMDAKELRESKSDIAYVMPSHQFPLGTVMPIARRQELLHWVREEEDRYIIEDDYDSEFRYKGKPIPALQSIDSSGKVIYIGTFSKSIAPAIRVSYMVLPLPLLIKYHEKKLYYSCTVSKIDQAMLTNFIKEGYFERHLNKMRRIYKGKHDLLLNELKKMSDICKVYGENAGLHILIEFKNQREEEVIQKARKNKVKLYGLSEYYIDGEIPPSSNGTLLLGYANLSEKEIIEAINILNCILR